MYKGKSKSYCTKHKLFCPWGEFFNINIQYEVVEKTEGIAAFEKIWDSANMGEWNAKKEGTSCNMPTIKLRNILQVRGKCLP